MVPLLSVLSSDEESWKSVVEPVFDIEKIVEVADAVEEPMAKSVVAVSPLLVAIESLANGEEVPMPIEPEVGSLKAVEVAGRLPKSIPPILRALTAVDEVAKLLLPINILFHPVVRLFEVCEAPRRMLA